MLLKNVTYLLPKEYSVLESNVSISYSYNAAHLSREVTTELYIITITS